MTAAFALNAFQLDAFQTCAFVEEVQAGDPREVEWLGGGGDKYTRIKRDARDYDFLDPEYWKRLQVPKEVEKAAAKIAKKVVKTAPEAIDTNKPVSSLKASLKRQQIAWDAFYADLLKQQIQQELAAEIQAHFVIQGIIDAQALRDAEDEEMAIVTMLMEL